MPQNEGSKVAPTASPGLHVRWGFLSLPGLVFLLVWFVAPLGFLVRLSFLNYTAPGASQGPWTVVNYTTFVTDPLYIDVFLDTLVLGLIVVFICALLGYPVAYFLTRTRSRARSMLIFMVFGPLLISSVIRNLGWLPLLGNAGFVDWLLIHIGLIRTPIALLNNFTGVVIGTVHAMLPFMILMLMTVLQRISLTLEEAAKNLGAGPWKTFWLVVFPLSLPGLVGGCLIVFTLTISSYTTPAMLGGNRVTVMATFIAQQVRDILDYPFGAAVAIILMAAAIVITALATRLTERRQS